MGAERGGLARFYARSPHLAHHKYCQRPETCTEKSYIREVLSYPCGLAISEHKAYKINAIERRG